MNTVTDVPSLLMQQLQARLATVPGFGEEVREDSVLRLIDAEDEELPNQLIVLQETSTEEGERQTPTSIKETMYVSLVLMCRLKDFGPPLRAGRLAVKQALKGVKAGLDVPGLIKVSWPSEIPKPPEDGRRWACRIIPLAITYTQQL
ncbi:hypothetical protein PHLH8_08080 [Pseudomonas sp. Pc102]|uniref:hypothetical protein n=1 Tax=Pseudomonas sp. Pc102 TaxID=2678261 RepID=UPI001BCDB1E3|nr:hypothetical protein [Pseudomonas sp. Pc102]BBP81166.1 hypothetical protein PHLH8_08080 [Pseudomonas sp. Pc102]